MKKKKKILLYTSRSYQNHNKESKSFHDTEHSDKSQSDQIIEEGTVNYGHILTFSLQFMMIQLSNGFEIMFYIKKVIPEMDFIVQICLFLCVTHQFTKESST